MSFKLIPLNAYIRPKLIENKSKNWVLNGRNNEFYQYIIDRYNGSPTNSAIIDSYIDLMIGKGIDARNKSLTQWVEFKRILSNGELRKLISDFILFNEAYFHVVKTKDGKGLGGIYHLPTQMTAPSIVNEDYEIDSYWFCRDFKHINTNKPVQYPSLGYEEGEKEHIYKLKPYKAGKEYFADPSYLSALPYCEMEEEIANYYVSHIKNGLSFGYIVNVPNGKNLTEEEQEDFERKIKSKLTGSQNAGKFILSFNDADGQATTVEVVQLNDSHKQWQYLTSEARQQIMTAHRVTSPMLFGIKDNTGFGNNADELDTAEAQLYKRVIQPKQELFLEGLKDVLTFYGINLDLYFRPLTEQATSVSMSSEEEELNDSQIDLLDLGGVISDDYELIKSREYSEDNTSVEDWFNETNFSDVITQKANQKSYLDKSVYKVRYSYEEKYSSGKSRGFCQKMMQRTSRGVVYRLEDIDKASRSGLNKSHGHKGQAYDLFKFKGGVSCGHYWLENLYKLKKGREDKGLSSSDPVDSIPKTYKPRPSGHKQAVKPPKDMPNNGHHPNYNK